MIDAENQTPALFVQDTNQMQTGRFYVGFTPILPGEKQTAYSGNGVQIERSGGGHIITRLRDADGNAIAVGHYPMSFRMSQAQKEKYGIGPEDDIEASLRTFLGNPVKGELRHDRTPSKVAQGYQDMNAETIWFEVSEQAYEKCRGLIEEYDQTPPDWYYFGGDNSFIMAKQIADLAEVNPTRHMSPARRFMTKAFQSGAFARVGRLLQKIVPQNTPPVAKLAVDAHKRTP